MENIDLEKELTAAVEKRFGRTVKNMIENESFNIYDAYEYLKEYAGIKSQVFTQMEYNKKITAIQNVLGL